VLGNTIGTDATGTFALGNSGDGIQIDSGTGNTVGGTTAGSGNLVSGNAGDGIAVSANGALVQGNLIGTDASGAAALGNGGNGVLLSGSNNTVGGTADAGNVIAFNGLNGVLVDQGTGNAILSNSIFSHSNGLGIQLTNGGNTNEPAPQLTSATSGGGTTTVAGTFTGTPNTTYVIQLFANTDANPSGFGEGETLLGTITVTTDGSGNASFSAVFDTNVSLGECIAATATDPSNNTSAFSNCVTVTG
jgi:titin